MTILYCTADTIGAPSGGGLVTKQECRALQEFAAEQLVTTRDPTYSEVMVFNRDNLWFQGDEPWKWDQRAYEKIAGNRTIKLAHFYSGTFGKTVAELKKNGCKVTYTIAAHDREVSRREHENLGWGFPYLHLTEEKLWQRYIEGYRLADVIITPGKVPEQTIRNYGPEFQQKNIHIIPHGCEIPEEVKTLPSNFTIAYMGSMGADKGVRYLLQAWKELAYKDGSTLVLAGKEVLSPAGKYLLARFGGGCIHIMGWVEYIATFYNSISCYIQPSATEGFGLEVLEAMAHGRPVLCSEGAGAVDLVPSGCSFQPCDIQVLKNKIHQVKEYGFSGQLEEWQKRAIPYTWTKIRSEYQKVWKEVLGHG